MQMVRVELSRLLSGTHGARRDFTGAELRALAASIAEHGLLSPLAVRKAGAPMKSWPASGGCAPCGCWAGRARPACW